MASSDSVTYELVAPFVRFQFGLPDGTTGVVDDRGFTTSDRTVIGNLDQHPLNVRRVDGEDVTTTQAALSAAAADSPTFAPVPPQAPLGAVTTAPVAGKPDAAKAGV